MDRVEKHLKYLSSVKDISKSYWLCLQDFKHGKLHFEIVKCPVSGQYLMACNLTNIRTKDYSLVECIKKFFLTMSLSFDAKVLGHRYLFLRYLEFLKKMEREPTLF